MEEHDELFQMQARLAYLVNQTEQMQWELARLSQGTLVSNTRISALTRHLLNPENQQTLAEKLAELTTQLETSQETINELNDAVKKLSRTQFKANTLNESKDQQATETLALLRGLITAREESKEAQKTQGQERVAELQSHARSELAADFLPVLDGIEMALEHKIALPEKVESAPPPDAAATGLFSRMLKPFAHESESHHDDSAQRTLHDLHDTVTRWLQGLEIVRDRFIRLLEREGIMRIPDVNRPFDPHLHVAVGVEERADAAENTIVSVVRKGYTAQGRVLRYAEVIVAKAPPIKNEVAHETHE